MDAFDEDAYTGTNDDNANNDYGAAAPPTPPPLPTDGFLRSPMKRNNDMHTSGASPYKPSSPFNNAAADDEGIFTSADGDGPLLPDPSQMREEGTAFREWRR